MRDECLSLMSWQDLSASTNALTGMYVELNNEKTAQDYKDMELALLKGEEYKKIISRNGGLRIRRMKLELGNKK